jgi:hypothetical protein
VLDVGKDIARLGCGEFDEGCNVYDGGGIRNWLGWSSMLDRGRWQDGGGDVRGRDEVVR